MCESFESTLSFLLENLPKKEAERHSLCGRCANETKNYFNKELPWKSLSTYDYSWLFRSQSHTNSIVRAPRAKVTKSDFLEFIRFENPSKTLSLMVTSPNALAYVWVVCLRSLEQNRTYFNRERRRRERRKIDIFNSWGYKIALKMPTFALTTKCGCVFENFHL